MLKNTAFIILVTLLLSCGNQKVENDKESVIECKIEHADWTKDAVIYKVNIQQVTPEGTIEAFMQKIPKIKDFGVDVIWLKSIQASGEENSNYEIVNSECGSTDDFRLLVERIHKLGMHIVFDFSLDRSKFENSNQERIPELEDEILEAMLYWVKDFNIDGYHCNNTDLLPIKFWNKVRSSLNKIKPVLLFTDNSENPELLEKAFDMNYNMSFSEIGEKILKDETDINKIVDFFTKEDSIYGKSCFRLRFTDENFKGNSSAQETFTTLLFTIPGVPMLNAGQECENLDFCKLLIALRTEKDLFWSGNAGGDFKLLDAHNNKVLAYKRSNEFADAFIILNLSDQIQEIKAPRGMAGAYRDYFAGESSILNENESLELAPWEYKVFLE
jgi:cyclomaltodextrinase